MKHLGTVVVPILFVLTACAGPSAKKSVEDIGDLASRIERVHDTAGRAKERARGAVERLAKLVAPEFEGDAVAAYAEFLDAVELSEKDAERLRDEHSPMRRAAAEVFEQWEKDLDAYSSPAMRERSGARLAATRQRFDAILKSLGPALDALDALHDALRDEALFLEHDLNRDAIALAREDVVGLLRDADRVEAALDVCQATTQAYVASTSVRTGALVSRAAQPETAGGGGLSR